MARFRYNGEPTRPYVQSQGPATAIKVPLKNGGSMTLTPLAPATEFVIGQDLGYDITDARALRVMRANTRYTEI